MITLSDWEWVALEDPINGPTMPNLNCFKIQVSEVNSIEIFIGSKVTHPCQGLVTIICFEGSLSSKNMNRTVPIVFGSMTHFPWQEMVGSFQIEDYQHGCKNTLSLTVNWAWPAEL